MIGLFVRLKLRLLRNVFRTPGGPGLFVFIVVATFVGAVAAIWVRDLDDRARLAIAPLAAAAIVAGWSASPLVFGSTDDTIDTTRLALFDLPARRLAPGMAAAGLVGPGPLAALLPLLGLASTAPDPLSIGVAVLAAIATMLAATTASRLALTALGAGLRRRRSRDLATVAAGVVVGAAAIGVQAVSVLDLDLRLTQVEGWARIAGRTPFGWTGRALAASLDGRPLTAVGWLVAAGALIITMGWVWVRVLDGVLGNVEEAEAAPVHGGHLLRPGSSARLGSAVLAKEVRYLRRHPRYRVQVVSQVIVLAIGGTPFLEAVMAGDPSATLLGAIPGLTAGMTGANLLGPDGRALWAETLALRSLRPLIRGRSLVFVGLGMGLATITTLSVAAITGGWRHVPVALGAALGMALIGAGTGAVTSTFAFSTYPDEHSANLFASTSPGNGCLNAVFTFGGVMVGLAVSLPILLALGRADSDRGVALTILLGAPIVGAAIWTAATAFAGRRVDRRTPEIVAALSVV